MKAKTIVVKLGTSSLTSGSNKLDTACMMEIVRAVVALKKQGHKVVVVSSGAIAAGRESLGYPNLPKTVSFKQMLAAVGQNYLMSKWQQLFEIYGLHIGQVLLTRADLEDRERYLNAKDALNAILSTDIIPIINENDAVAIAEIKVGDNDNLSARAAILVEADLLILLTDQKGLYTADPRSDKDAKLIRVVEKITSEIKALAGDSVSGLGTGGMATKLQAAEIATRSGIDVVIASCKEPSIVLDIINGEFEGTYFKGETSPLEARKSWILAGHKRSKDCFLQVDDGASKVLVEKNSSLLPKGIVNVSGEFLRGDVVSVVNSSMHEIARGIVRYNGDELRKIIGHNSDEIGTILGYEHGHVAIHYDDLVLV